MTVDGYSTHLECDAERDDFRGEILSLNGSAEFYGCSPKELRDEFRKSLNVFLQVCEEGGIDPYRHFSGKFNLRISPELHERLAIQAQAKGVSINALVQECLQRGVVWRVLYEPKRQASQIPTRRQALHIRAPKLSG